MKTFKSRGTDTLEGTSKHSLSCWVVDKRTKNDWTARTDHRGVDACSLSPRVRVHLRKCSTTAQQTYWTAWMQAYAHAFHREHKHKFPLQEWKIPVQDTAAWLVVMEHYITNRSTSLSWAMSWPLLCLVAIVCICFRTMDQNDAISINYLL